MESPVRYQASLGLENYGDCNHGMQSSMHGEPDAGKLARPARREGHENLPPEGGKAAWPYFYSPQSRLDGFRQAGRGSGWAVFRLWAMMWLSANWWSTRPKPNWSA
ncbi:hypothetical protein WCLP8_1830003 [uncultured Gammaproteobacteria bacterium]